MVIKSGKPSWLPPLFVASSVALGCSGDSKGDQPEGPAISDGLDLAGVVVMIGRPSADVHLAFNLLDPRSNLRSELQYPLSGSVRPGYFSLNASPDGRSLVHMNPAGVVILTRVVAQRGTILPAV